MIEESQTPDGYVKSGEDSTFYVHVDGGVITYLIRSSSADDASQKIDQWDKTRKESGLVTYDSETNTATVKNTVKNTPGTQLPQTGGIGTTLFTALGGLMTATAGAILTMKSYRRREENA